MDEFFEVAKVNEIPPGGKKLVEVDGYPVALFNVDGAFYAIEDVCTHDGGPLAEGSWTGTRLNARDTVRGSTSAPEQHSACPPLNRWSVMKSKLRAMPF